MVSKIQTPKTRFAAIFNEGFPSKEDDRYFDTVQAMKDWLSDNANLCMVGETISSNYQIFHFSGDEWKELSIDALYSTNNFYTEDEWAKVLGL